MSEESRQYPREPFDATVRTRCATWPEFIDLYTRNISQGGVFVRHEVLPELGADVDIHIQMPNMQVLKLTGRVAHIVDESTAEEKGIASGFGIEFTNVTGDAVKAIAELLKTAKQHQHAPPPPVPPKK